MKWKHTRPDEWVSRPFFIRRSDAGYSLWLSDGTDFGRFLAGALPSLAEAKRAAAIEEGARRV